MTEAKIIQNEEMKVYQHKIAKMIPKISKLLTQVKEFPYMKGKENALQDFKMIYKMMKWNAMKIVRMEDQHNTALWVTGMMSPEQEKKLKSTDAEYLSINISNLEWFLFTASIAQSSTMMLRSIGELKYIEQNLNEKKLVEWITLDDSLTGTHCTQGTWEEMMMTLGFTLKENQRLYQKDLAMEVLIHSEIFAMLWKGRWDQTWDKESTAIPEAPSNSKEKYINLKFVKRTLQLYEEKEMRSYMLGYISCLWKNIHELIPKWRAHLFKIINEN